MRHYKDSGIVWIGKIPEDWKLSRLKFVLRSPIESGKRPNESEGKILSVGGEHIQNGNFDLSRPMYVTESTYFVNKGKIQLNDTLVVKDGATIGKCMYVKSMPNEKMLLNEHVYRISCSKFYYYWILSEIAQKWFRVRNQSTAQESITGPTIMNLPILLCSQTEQQRIVDFLDEKCVEIDSLIGLQDQMIEKLKIYKQSVISEAVTKGLNPNVLVKRSGIDWIKNLPVHWNVITPKALFSLRKEKAKKGERQLTASQQYGIIYQDEYMQLTGTKIVTVMKDFDILKHVESGDFVISMRSFQGGLEYSENTGSISSAYVMLIPNPKYVYPKFYRWLFKSSFYINALQSTSNMVRDGQAMRYSNFAQVPLYVVPLSEQKEIASYLDEKCADIDRLIDLKQQKIEKLKDYKKSLIYEAVTGKLNLHY